MRIDGFGVARQDTLTKTLVQHVIDLLRRHAPHPFSERCAAAVSVYASLPLTGFPALARIARERARETMMRSSLLRSLNGLASSSGGTSAIGSASAPFVATASVVAATTTGSGSASGSSAASGASAAV